MPDTENPSTPERESTTASLMAAEITDEEFHTLSDQFLEKVHEKAEQVQESREDVEVEYAVSESTSCDLDCRLALHKNARVSNETPRPAF